MKHIPLTAIDFDSATQLRAEINTETVNEYAERMADGDKFPPVDLFEVGDRYLIGDGWHRLLAYQKNEQVTIEAEIHTGGRSAAIRFALGANAKHGMARTNADKRKAVETALKEFPNLSNREIARICGVSHHTVSKVRDVGELPTSATRTDSLGRQQPARKPQRPFREFARTPETRIGADGKERRMPTRKDPIPPMPEIEEEKNEQKPEVKTGVNTETEPQKPKRLPTPQVDSARGIWLLAKAQLDKIIPQDLSREAVLNEIIEYAQDRLNNRK